MNEPETISTGALPLLQHAPAHARGAKVAIVAFVSNSVDEATGHFDTGGHRSRLDVRTAVARTAQALISRTLSRSGIAHPAMPLSGTST